LPGAAPVAESGAAHCKGGSCAQLGTVYDLNIGKLCPKANVVRMKSNNEALLTVQAGRADCQIIVIIFALTTITRDPGLGHLVVPKPLFGSTTNGMLAKEVDPGWRDYVDAWIDKRRGAGELRRVLVDNLGQVGVPGSDLPPELLF
jgi:polar amino acid transport system substrate-binding protein